jgi:hypothetical protein
MQYSSKFQNICYGAQGISKIHWEGYCRCIEYFGHEQYPSKCDIDPWCLITKYLNEGIGFLVGFGKVTQYLFMCQKICHGAQ